MPKGTRRALDWGANEEVALRVASYRPRTIDEPLWAAVQPFVLSCASELPLAGWAGATLTLRVLAQIGFWAVGVNRPGFLGDSIPWKRGWRDVRSTEAVPA